jgi:hypothetical protein
VFATPLFVQSLVEIGQPSNRLPVQKIRLYALNPGVKRN